MERSVSKTLKVTRLAGGQREGSGKDECVYHGHDDEPSRLHFTIQSHTTSE